MSTTHIEIGRKYCTTGDDIIRLWLHTISIWTTHVLIEGLLKSFLEAEVVYLTFYIFEVIQDKSI